MLGQSISHYTILKKIGGGGMGVVYEAQDNRLGRHVALKFLPEVSSRNREALQRFQREARAASKLEHPYICAIHDVDEFDGQPFIVMQLLRGHSLRHFIYQQGMDIKTILRLGAQVAGALAEAHKHGIIHRDIKPSNIFVTDIGDAKVLDFGLAKLSESQDLTRNSRDHTLSQEGLTSPGIAMGTVTYMSPEQALGEELDERSDIFSLGVTLYEMATGQLPFSGSTSAAVFDAILHKNPLPPSSHNAAVPLELDALIGKALQKDKAQRFQSAGLMETEIKKLQLAVDSNQLRTSGPRSLRRDWLSAKRRWAATLVAAVALAVAFLMWQITTSRMIVPKQPLLDARNHLEIGIGRYNNLSEADTGFSVIEEFQSAIADDPNFAEAHFWLSRAYWHQGTYKARREGKAGREEFDKAWNEVETAIRINPNLAAGYHWKARMLAFYLHDWEAAEEEYRKARELDGTMLPHAEFLLWRHRREEALQSIEKSLNSAGNIYSATRRCEAGWNYYFAGDIAKAYGEAQEAIRINNNWASAYWLSAWCSEKLNHEEAVVRYARYALQYQDLPASDIKEWLVEPYLTSRMKGFWRALVREFPKQVHPYHQAAIYVKLDDPDNAFEVLSQLSGAPLEQPLVADVRFDPIRKDPRYGDLLKSLGLNR